MQCVIPNGYGGIRKLSGKRRKPYGVYITTGMKLAHNLPDIDFLKGILSEGLYSQVEEEYDAYRAKQMPSAKQEQKCIGYYATRQEALIALAEYNKSPYDLAAKKVTFKEIYDILFEQQFNKMKTQAKTAYVTAYKKCGEIENICLSDMRKAHMQKIVDDHADKSKSTQSNLLKLFHAVYRFALENDICQKDYSEFVTITSEKESKDKVPFSRDEIALLWNKLDWKISNTSKNGTDGQQFVDSVLIMIYTGCRISELLDMKVEDIHLEERWIDLRGTKTKAARRIVPIHKKIIPLIERRMQGTYLLEVDGKKLAYTKYTRFFFDPMCEAFGMKHTPHECRHSFATYAAAYDLNKTLLKKIIGHSAKDLTEDTYTHTFIEDLIKEIEKLQL